MRKTFQVQSQKLSSAMMKLALMRTATGKEDPELPLLQRIHSLELPALEIAGQINASKSNRDISTSTVQRRLHVSCLHSLIATKKPLLKDTNNKKRLAWAIRQVEICPLVWWIQTWDFWFQKLCLCKTQSRWTDGGGGVMVFCWWHYQWFIFSSRHT